MTEECVVLDLGLVDYQAAWNLQRSLVRRRLRGEIRDTLLLLEHPSVYTVGRRGSVSGLRDLGLPVYEVERGGDVTFHGPGQLVGYPIMALKKGKLDVRSHVNRLEETLRRVATSYGLTPEEGPHAGLWAGGKKLASIGVAVKHYVTYHGFALNVSVDLAPFKRIQPCGLDATRIASLQEMLDRPVDMDEVKGQLMDCFAVSFHMSLLPGKAEQAGLELLEKAP